MSSGTELIDDIRRAIPLFLSHGGSGHESLCIALMADGRTRTVAEAITVFVPLAFGRIILANAGVKLTEAYCRPAANGQVALRRLAKQPVFAAATELVLAGEVDEETFTAIAKISGEMVAANKALFDGSRLEDLMLAEPFIEWPVEEMNATSGEARHAIPLTDRGDRKPAASKPRRGWFARLFGQ